MRFLIILDLGLHHYTWLLSHLALSELVAVGHLSQLAQRGVLPLNQLVQLLGLQNKIIDKSTVKYRYRLKLGIQFILNAQQRLTSRSLVLLDSARPCMVLS